MSVGFRSEFRQEFLSSILKVVSLTVSKPGLVICELMARHCGLNGDDRYFLFVGEGNHFITIKH